ncbi:MAG: type IV pilus assembly protein PilM [Deltaproteobacteria bacterium]|nr:type IV pilus assembly protein PilM [bacterium]MCB9477299.1 type IV pilus assembly protein PilM [Deltaproteobacteria bacterium]MCB9478765.1 type IV pilus assembly protein PilM [Deltaproteobacteria bacterium]MCB9488281.1 type IV pilus assembly protein PilM [Deltaproteobacteria bacterium]
MFLSRSKSVLGLDIGSSSIKVLELKETKTGYQLVNFGIEPLPPETIVDSTIMNAPAVVSAIRKLLDSNQIKAKDVATSVSGHSVIIRKITLPLMTDEEIASNIQWEAEQYIPFDINEVNIDYQRLDAVSEDQGSQDVLLVAVKKDMVNDYVAVINEAGLNPVVMDVDAFCVQNMYEINYEMQRGKVIALVNIGAGVININIVRNGSSVFTRDMSIGGNHYTEEIQKQFGLSFEEAEALKVSGDPQKQNQLDEIMRNLHSAIALETQRSLDFFVATSSMGQISKVFLSGGCAKNKGLSETIERQVGIPVEVVNPFNNIEINPNKFDMEYIQDVAPMCGVVVGLALRRADDK